MLAVDCYDGVGTPLCISERRGCNIWCPLSFRRFVLTKLRVIQKEHFLDLWTWRKCMYLTILCVNASTGVWAAASHHIQCDTQKPDNLLNLLPSSFLIMGNLSECGCWDEPKVSLSNPYFFFSKALLPSTWELNFYKSELIFSAHTQGYCLLFLIKFQLTAGPNICVWDSRDFSFPSHTDRW